MANEVIEIELNLNDKFKAAFPNRLIPTNCYLDKSKTGLGMTYAEFHAERHSIIVIPYTNVIELKSEEYKDKHPFKVMDEVKTEAIATYLKSNVKYKKIVTTPEGFSKIIEAAKSIEQLDWLYKNFFCFLDEAHSYAVDAFRKYILIPFTYFWEFKSKALGTATYYPYSDPRFDTLQRYKIKYEDTFGEIKIVDHDHPKTVLHYFLTNPDQFPGNVHIFYNSVKEIEKVVRSSGIKDVNIYCRDDERNMQTLGDASVHFRSTPNAEDYKKYNFYSARYYDGWDLFDNAEATIILVTDIKIKHSLVGIKYNGFQAVGRLRKELPNKIYHVTNNFKKLAEEVRSFEYIKENWFYQADNHVCYYNKFKEQAKQDGMEEKQVTERFVAPFAKFSPTKATVFPLKVDQHICKEYSKEGYANLETIKQNWNEMNYGTDVVKFDLEPLITKNLSHAKINKQLVELIEEYAQHPDKYLYSKAKTTIDNLKNRFNYIFQAYEVLKKPRLEELKYDDRKIKAALVALNNENLMSALKEEVKIAYVLDTPYTNSEATSKLQNIYDQLGIKNPDGTRAIANVGKLDKLEIYVIRRTNINDPKGMLDPKTGRVKKIPAVKLVGFK